MANDSSFDRLLFETSTSRVITEKKGAIVKINGIPVELIEDTKFRVHVDNIRLIDSESFSSKKSDMPNQKS